jgi:hypothetical protein
MATYIMLSSLTDEGRKTLKERPERLKEVNQEIERMGARVVTQYAVLGVYDFINIIEAPSNEVNRPNLGRARRAWHGAADDAPRARYRRLHTEAAGGGTK